MKKILLILKKNILILTILAVLGIIGIGVKILLEMKKDIKKIENEVQTKYEEVQKYETSKEEAPSQELINELSEEDTGLKHKFNSLLTKFSTIYPIVPKFNEDFSNVEYKEFLLETEDFLMKKSKRNGVILPSSLGFSETGFPTTEEIKRYSLQLAVLKNFLDILIDARVSVVNSIVPGVPKSEAFYQILPLDVSITGTSAEIIRFFKYLNSSSSFFTLERFSITNVESDTFKAGLTINALILNPEGGGAGENISAAVPGHVGLPNITPPTSAPAGRPNITPPMSVPSRPSAPKGLPDRKTRKING